MYILITAALAAALNVIWWIWRGSWEMPFWAAAVIILGSAATVEVLEGHMRHRRLRRGRTRRAHARSAPRKPEEL